MRREFEFTEGSSRKFWEITLDGTVVRTRYGKLGTVGQQTVKVAETELQASKLLAKLVAEKTGKGYREVTADSAARSPAAKVTSGASTPRAARKFPTKIPLAFGASPADINHGVIAFRDGNLDLFVIEPGAEPRKVPLAWRSKRYADGTIPLDMSGLKVVRHDDAPCLAVSWVNARNCSLNPPTDGPGIGLFRLDGSPIAIRYYYDGKARKPDAYDHTKLLAASPSGDRLAWNQGYDLHAISVADFVAGRDAHVWKDVSPSWAAIDARGVVYAPNGVEGFAFAAEGPPTRYADHAQPLHAFGEGLISTDLVITGGKTRAIASAPWMRGVQGKPGDFTLTTAAGRGDVVCVGPGSHKTPHLCFVQASTGKLVSVKKRPRRGVFTLHLVDDTLYIVDDKEVSSMPWPEDGKCA